MHENSTTGTTLRAPAELRAQARQIVQTFSVHHAEWTAEQWFWRWLDRYDEPTTLASALQSNWCPLVGEQAVREAHAKLLPLGVTR